MPAEMIHWKLTGCGLPPWSIWHLASYFFMCLFVYNKRLRCNSSIGEPTCPSSMINLFSPYEYYNRICSFFLSFKDHICKNSFNLDIFGHACLSHQSMILITNSTIMMNCPFVVYIRMIKRYPNWKFFCIHDL